MVREGMGLKDIVEELVRLKAPVITWREYKGDTGVRVWTLRRADHLLRSRAVIGYEGDRLVYPPALHEKYWERTQELRKQAGGGRREENLNYFPGLVFCAGCKKQMRFRSRPNHKSFFECGSKCVPRLLHDYLCILIQDHVPFLSAEAQRFIRDREDRAWMQVVVKAEVERVEVRPTSLTTYCGGKVILIDLP